MAADLSIHIVGDIPEDDFKAFFHNTLGSYYEDLWNEELSAKKDAIFEKFANSPSIEVGKVWRENIDRVDSLIPEYPHPVLTWALIDQIMEAFKMPCDDKIDACTVAHLRKFLNDHIGEQIFTVGW